LLCLRRLRIRFTPRSIRRKSVFLATLTRCCFQPTCSST
jgi:hypothetical protein